MPARAPQQWHVEPALALQVVRRRHKGGKGMKLAISMVAFCRGGMAQARVHTVPVYDDGLRTNFYCISTTRTRTVAVYRYYFQLILTFWAAKMCASGNIKRPSESQRGQCEAPRHKWRLNTEVPPGSQGTQVKLSDT